MPASPAPPPRQTVADRFIVLLGPEDGSAPTKDDECRWLVPVSVSTFAGADRIDTIVCRIDQARGGPSLRDTAGPTNFRRQIEIRRIDENNEPTDVVGWGMVAIDSQEIAEGEIETITARLDGYLFGDVLHEVPYWDGVAGEVKNVHLPLVFNPTIDGVMEPNMSSETNPDRGDSPLFVHPESLRLEPARTLQDQTASEWTLSKAVHFLCWHLNPDQTYIDNPTIDDLATPLFEANNFARVRNFSLKYGRNLLQLLDDLLTPFNYGCHIVHSLEGETRHSRFAFFERGEGSRVSLLMQGEGTIDVRKTNVARFSLNYDISRLSNEIIGQGGLKRYEATFPLVPAWEAGDDDTPVETLVTGGVNALTKQFVGRKLVLNEAGDYDGLRDWIEGHYDLEPILGANHLVRRRKFLPCLSQHARGDDLASNGYLVEWWDEDQTDASDHNDPEDPGWVKAKEPFRVLEHECGILFTGSGPVSEFLTTLQEAFSPTVQSLWVRITCSIEGDEAITHRSTKRDSSPNGEVVPLYLDVSDRFKLREVDSTSIFSGGTADERDDQTDLETYCDKVRDNNDQAEVSLGITLMTANHPEYKIGQLIEKVEGRNLTFSANAAGETPRELQIVGIVKQLDGQQRTQLLVESFELEQSDLERTT